MCENKLCHFWVNFLGPIKCRSYCLQGFLGYALCCCFGLALWFFMWPRLKNWFGQTRWNGQFSLSTELLELSYRICFGFGEWFFFADSARLLSVNLWFRVTIFSSQHFLVLQLLNLTVSLTLTLTLAVADGNAAGNGDLVPLLWLLLNCGWCKL